MKHFNFLSTAKKFMVAGAVLLFAGAQAQTTVYDVISTSPVHNTLTLALNTAGLGENGPLDDLNTDYTVFAPTDAAFSALLTELELEPGDLLADPDLSSTLLYHVIAGEVLSTDLVNATYAPTAQGDSIFVSLLNSGAFADQAPIDLNNVDVPADNGVVHFVDDVLFPGNSVVDIAVSAGFNILAEAVVAAELAPALTDPLVDYTVFAPTDDAFVGLLGELEITKEELLADADLASYLLYHVIDGQVLSTDLVNGTTAPTLEGSSVFVSLLSSGAFVDQAMIDLDNVDIDADNGTIHVIGDVLLPGNSIVDIAVDAGFSVLAEAVVAAELAPALTDPLVDYTVFAPTDDAFVGLLGELEITKEELLADADLASYLLYHVIDGQVLSTDLVNGTTAPTLEGSSVFVSLLSSGAFVDQAMIDLDNVDIDADNGTIHVIDDVLLPGNSIVDIAVDAGFSVLAEAVVAAELAPALVDPLVDYTVFAPTDDAFVGLLGELEVTKEELLADPDLASILLYHVIDGQVLSTDLENGAFATTLLDDDVFVSLLSSGAFVDQAMIDLNNVDIDADNGTIHVIDDVLLPGNSIVDIAVDAGFSVLAEAVVAAELAPDLVDPLVDYTVFAPTDDAFVGLLGELEVTKEELLADPDLASILLYHVIDGQVLSTDLENGTFATTLLDDDVFVSLLSSGAFVDQAMIDLNNVDIDADNGTIHVIDDVLLPGNSIVDIAVDAGFSVLAEAVVAGELAPALIDPLVDYTVFAPTDDAFVALLGDLGVTKEELLADENLAEILLYHVIDDEVLSGELTNGGMATTLQGESVTFDLTTGAMVDNANIDLNNVDIDADNGTIHVIDAVILPSTITSLEDEIFGNMELYPNPTVDFIKLNANRGLEYSISNVEGVSVDSGDVIVGENAIDVSSFSTGSYLITLSNQEVSRTFKFQKQ